MSSNPLSTDAPAERPAPRTGRRWASINAIRTRTMVVSICALAATMHGVVDPEGRATRAPDWLRSLLGSA